MHGLLNILPNSMFRQSPNTLPIYHISKYSICINTIEQATIIIIEGLQTRIVNVSAQPMALHYGKNSEPYSNSI